MPTYEQRYGHPRTHYADGSRRRDIRREDAEDRQAKRDARTPQRQLELLDQKLGKNTGAIRERLRLHSPEQTNLEQPIKKAEAKLTRKERKKARRQ